MALFLRLLPPSSSSTFLFSPFFPRFQEPRLLCLQSSPSRTFPPRRNPSPCSCTAEISSKKKKRTSRASKSDQELSHELLEFKCAMGMPEDHVLTLKELRDNGRNDLANILRRRGYKAISELLRLSKLRDSELGKNHGAHEDPRNDNAKENTEDQETTKDIPSQIVSSSDLIQEEKTVGHSNGAVFRAFPIITRESLESSVEASQFKSDKFGQGVQLAIKGEDKDSVTHLAPKAQERNNQNEIDRLKLLLQQKEIELAHLKQQFENEEIVLNNLQAKAEAEIGKVQRIIAEKDLELQAVEECLDGLKEVRVDYFVHGQLVEVSGSFNGWQHRVQMNLQNSSASQDSPISRKQLLWSTVLWLYPGVYEIKFIVDGYWRIDPQREITTIGVFTNNVLRVDR